MENVIVFDHPLIQHKISILRNKNTGTNEFRALIEEIAMLMGYEALRDLPLEYVEVETYDRRPQTGYRTYFKSWTWHGKWYPGTGSKCKGWTYRSLQR